jgi:WD40 repeat protein
MPRVFISYSSRNRSAAVAVERALESAGLDVWRDERRLENDWSAEIAQALARADLLCLLWSQEAAGSRWVRNEWLTARALEKLIVPCLFPGAPELPPEIQNMQGVAFANTPAGWRKLARHIGGRTKLEWKYDFRTPVKGYVPFAPDDDFIGRKDDLLSIYLGLIGQLNKVGVTHLGVVGMGGVGKTALAIEFAHRFGAGFDGVYWVQGQSLAQLLAELVRLARDRLRLAIDDPHGADANGRYLRALAAHASAHPQMLLIIDNVTDPQSLVAGRFPPLALGCNVLFTTRTAFTLAAVAAHSLEILRPEPALDLLTRHRPPPTTPEAEAAREIANAVGYLPLALALIASHLRRFPQVSYARYLKTLRTHELAAIDSTRIDPSELATRHEAAVGVTLRSQWSMMRDPAARLLLKVAAHLPEASVIPAARLGLLTDLADGESATALRLSRPLHLLRQLSLIGGGEPGRGEPASAIRVHPLVAAVVRELMPKRERSRFLHAAALRLKKAYGNLARLEAEHRSRGIDSVIEDIGAARAWAGADRDLRLLERLLDRERHHLRPPAGGKGGTVPQLGPGFFQQLHLRAALLGLPDLAARLLDAGRREGRAMVRLRASTATDDVGLLRVFHGHEDAVVAVGMSQDGRRLVTASMRGQIIVWDVATGQIVRVLGGHASADAAAVSPDGRRAFSAGWERGARRDEETLIGWDLETGEQLWKDGGHEGTIAVLLGGSVILTGAPDGSVLLRDTATGRRMARLKGPGRHVAAAAVSLDGRRAITGDGRGVVSVWDLEAKRLLYHFEIDPSPDNIRRGITALSLTSDGQSAAIAAGYGGRDTVDYFGPDREGRLFLWDLGERRVLRPFVGHTGPVNAVSFNGDGSRLLSGSSDKTLKLWNVHTGRCLRTFTGHTREVTSVSLTSDGRLASSGGWDANAILWDLGAGHRARPPIGHALWVRSASIDDRGSIAATSSDDHSVILWNVATGKRARVLEGHTDRVNRVALASDGSRAVSGDHGGIFILWNTRTGRPRLNLDAKKGRIHAVGLSPDGRLVLSGSAMSWVLVWDSDTGRLLQGFRHPDDVDDDRSDGVTSLLVSPDGKTATSANESSLKLYAWDLGAVAKHHDQILAADRVTQLALQRSLEKPLGVFRGHTRVVLAIDGDADGRRILSGSEDRTAIVWSAKDRRPLLHLNGHAQVVTGVAFASNDRAVTVSWDRTLVLWDLKSGQPVQRLFFDSQLFAIAARNGRIVAGDVGGGVYFLDIAHGGRRA